MFLLSFFVATLRGMWGLGTHCTPAEEVQGYSGPGGKSPLKPPETVMEGQRGKDVAKRRKTHPEMEGDI